MRLRSVEKSLNEVNWGLSFDGYLPFAIKLKTDATADEIKRVRFYGRYYSQFEISCLRENEKIIGIELSSLNSRDIEYSTIRLFDRKQVSIEEIQDVYIRQKGGFPLGHDRCRVKADRFNNLGIFFKNADAEKYIDLGFYCYVGVDAGGSAVNMMLHDAANLVVNR